MIPRNRVRSVVCWGCEQRMEKDRIIAGAVWTQTDPTVYVQYVCRTPDCGTTIIIEEDAP